jgi:hypothetical protein
MKITTTKVGLLFVMSVLVCEKAKRWAVERLKRIELESGARTPLRGGFDSNRSVCIHSSLCEPSKRIHFPPSGYVDRRETQVNTRFSCVSCNAIIFQ